MNNDCNDLTPEERTWMESAGQALRASENEFDAVTTARLRAARARAMAAVSERNSPWLLAAPAALTAALLAWTLLPRTALQPEPVTAVNLAGLDALELLTDEQGPEFYENLDLYLWLEEAGGAGSSGA